MLLPKNLAACCRIRFNGWLKTGIRQKTFFKITSSHPLIILRNPYAFPPYMFVQSAFWVRIARGLWKITVYRDCEVLQ